MSQPNEIVKSFETIVDMVRDRALYADISEIIKFRDEEIGKIADNARPVFTIDFASMSLRIVYDMHPKFKVNDVKKMLEYDGVILLVSREKPGTLALKGIEEATKNVQVFDINELQFNVARHNLVPSHTPVRDEDEINQIIADTCVKNKTQMPLLYNTDAMARYLALKPGQLVRILRLSPSAGESITYRVCVKAAS
jgi:DNA-directed RNA polymerase subunit H